MKSVSENIPVHRVQLPASKSISNRLLMLKYSCFRQLQLHGLSTSEDTRLLQRLLEKISVADATAGRVELDVGNCGTAFRFLLPYLSLKSGKWRLVGSERMCARPIRPLADVLRVWGADIRLPDSGSLPLEITGCDLHPVDIFVDISQSSQFLSALLLSLPALHKDVCLRYDVSASSVSYIQTTLQLMQDLGMDIRDRSGEIIYSASSSELKKTDCTVEGDWSAAAFWWAWTALQPAPYRLLVEHLADTGCQADAKIYRLLSSWGIRTRFTEEGAWVEKMHPLHLPGNFVFDGRNCLDLVPLLSVLCHLLDIPHVFTGVENLKLKESNRSEAVQANLLSASAGPPFFFHSYNDHRIVMAFTLFAALGKVSFDYPECVVKSYPAFWEQFR